MNYFNERNEVVENYARALFESSIDSNLNIIEIINDLDSFNNTLINTESKELKNLLYYPLISVDDKIEVIHAVFDQTLERIVVDFIITLTEEQRISFLHLIIEEIKMINRFYSNIVKVQAKFGIEPTMDEIENIKKKIKNKLLCTDIEFEYEVDKSLIGGVKLFYNGKYIDNTLVSKINRFVNQIKL